MSKKIISWTLFILWLLLIFFFSHQNGDSSQGLSNGILSLFHIYNEIMTFVIRKLAHFTEYLILGILTVNLLNNINDKKIFICLLFCFLYAVSDEFHQSFIVDRSPALIDILIDYCGSLFGCISYILIRRRVKE